MKHDVADIVVTGLSAISAAGVGIDPLLTAVASDRCCLSDVPETLAIGAKLRWGRADQFRAADFMPPLKARKFDRSSIFAVVASGQALANAGIRKGDISPDRIGITIGAGFCGIANSEEFISGYFLNGVDGVAPMLFPNTVANAAASNASIEHGLQGPNVTAVQRFCSAESALQLACRFMEEGRADVMVTGGVDELTPRMMQGFRDMRQDRLLAAGFAEGCGAIVLERRSHAESRGAKILAGITTVSSIGRLLAGREEEALHRLLPSHPPAWVSLSGSADLLQAFADALPGAKRISTAALIGRSLAMGGVSMAALIASLSTGEHGLHLAASPEGPYFAINFIGGSPA